MLQVSGIKVEEHRGWRCGSTEEERLYSGMMARTIKHMTVLQFMDKVQI